MKEQIQSLGAKFIEFDLGESGSGSGDYAKALSPEAQKKQQQSPKRYVILMALLVVGGTILDMIHKKSAQYFG